MPNTKSFTADGNLTIKGTSDKASVTVIQGIDTGWSGTVIVQGALRGTTNFVPIPYKRRSLIAAASDDTIVNATITDTAFLIEVGSTGLDLKIVVTRSAGTLTLNYLTLNA